jgi:hypothetical protein
MTTGKKTDNGLLPVDHPSIVWLADKGHRVCQFANKLFKLARKKKSDCEATNLDAERLKRNLSFAICTHCLYKDVSCMRATVENVLEHHFNNHEDCGEWCKVKQLEGDELVESMLHYR